MRRAHSFCVLICVALTTLSFAHHIKPGLTKALPITTSSPKARDLYVRAGLPLAGRRYRRLELALPPIGRAARPMFFSAT